MKIINKIIEFMIGTSILWLPILGSIIAEQLSEMINMEQIIKFIYILIPVLLIISIKMDIEDEKEERRLRKHGQVR